LRLPFGRIGLLLVLSVGLAATVFWLHEGRGLELDRFGAPLLGLGLLLVVSLSVPNLALRWFRWHFLLRRTGFRVPARDSMLVWVIGLPSLLTPFSVGELFRSLLLRRRHPGIGPAIAAVWLVERSCDVAVLATFLALASGRTAVAALIPAAWIVLGLGARGLAAGFGSRLLRPRPLGATLLATALAWAFPVLGFFALVARLGSPIGLDLASAVFSKGTLLGGLVGLPLGIGLAGSLFVVELQAAGVGLPVAIAGTALLRTGTAWFSVGLGGLVLLAWRRTVGSVVGPAGGEHFDAIAEDYRDEIPEHVRARLLERKVRLMRAALTEAGIGPGARGLDVGCGQGWYAAEMMRSGYRIHGVDSSARQVEAARAWAREQRLAVALEVGSVTSLPYDDDSFDFVYAINVLHHLSGEAASRAALGEIVRVLRPGGRFLLHEINTRNPLFQFYMGYVFPVLRSIDEGTERWLRPDRLPAVPGADWSPEVEYFTFLPEFVSAGLGRRLRPLEAALERSVLRHWSAHYLARLRKRDR
jgi:ubiquinone/menaquinone biosynthesis C-methylase UbiE